LLSDEHFTVDETLLEAYEPRVSSARMETANRRRAAATSRWTFHGVKRSNEMHESTKDGDVLLAKKSAGKQRS